MRAGAPCVQPLQPVQDLIPSAASAAHLAVLKISSMHLSLIRWKILLWMHAVRVPRSIRSSGNEAAVTSNPKSRRNAVSERFRFQNRSRKGSLDSFFMVLVMPHHVLH
jgi:hypothetical protein